MFNRMPLCDVVTWNVMISGHVKCGQGQKALGLFQQIQQKGVEADLVTLVGVLNACASVVALEEGMCAHIEQIIESGWDSDVFIGNCSVDMHAKCGNMEDVYRVFNKIPLHDVVPWNAILFGHVKCGQGEKALELFQQMQQEEVQLDPVTFVGVLNPCASVVALEEGRCAHEQIIQSGCDSDNFMGSSLVDMYAKCGTSEKGIPRCSHEMSYLGMLLVAGFAMHGHGNEALEHFEQMCQEGVEPDHFCFSSISL